MPKVRLGLRAGEVRMRQRARRTFSFPVHWPPASTTIGHVTITYAPGRPNWVDLGTNDPAAASSFYGGLFGWTTQDLGPEAGGYRLLRLHGKDVGGIGP